MKKRKEALQGATDFHYENFLRRSRYTSVFLILLAAFCVITVLNINTGNVDISIFGKEIRWNITLSGRSVCQEF